MKTEFKYFQFLLKQNKRMIGLYSLILLATFPLLLYFLNSYAYYAFYTYALVGQCLNLVVALLASVIIPLSIFKYTSSKKSLDVYDALPLQKETMFRVNYVVGLLILLIPFIISWLIGIIYVSSVWPTVLNVVGSSSYLSEAEFFILSTQFKHLIEIIVPLALCYTMTVQVKQNTGSIVDAAIYTVIIHVIPMLAYWAFYAYCNTTILGFADEWSYEVFQLLAPLVAPFKIIFTENTSFVSLPRMGYYAVCTLILFIGSSHLYVSHKSERCEQPFTTKYFFPVVSNVATIILLILLFSAMNADVFSLMRGNIRVVYPILLSLIVYLLLDVIAHRGFKNVYRASIKYLIIASISIALLAPIEFTNGFGYVTRIPDASEIESIEIKVPYYINELHGITSGTQLTIETEENIQKIVDYHKYLLDRYAEYDYHDDLVVYDEAINDYPYDIYATLNFPITIKYHTEDKTIIREYRRVPMKWTKALLELENNEDLINAKLIPSGITKYFGNPEYRIICTYMEYSNMYNEAFVLDESKYEATFDAQTFFEAYRKDLENHKDKYSYECTEAPYMRLYLRFEAIVSDTLLESSEDPIHTAALDGRYYPIEKTYTNTIAYLDSLGIKPEKTFSEKDIDNVYLIRSTDANPSLFFYSNYPLDDFSRFDLNIEYFELTYDDILLLEPYMRSHTYYDESGYILCIDKDEYSEDFYIISSEHKDIIESIIKDKQSTNTTSNDFLESLYVNTKY